MKLCGDTIQNVRQWIDGICFMFEFSKMLVAVHCLCSKAGAAVGVRLDVLTVFLCLSLPFPPPSSAQSLSNVSRFPFSFLPLYFVAFWVFALGLFPSTN